MAPGGRFELGDDSELTFVIEGGTRVTPGTVGDPGTYPAIDIETSNDPEFAFDDVKAELGGALVLDFDYPGVGLGETFDLIVATGAFPLTGGFGSRTITGLPGNLAAYGNIVADGMGSSIYRVTVTCPGDFDGSGDVGVTDLLDLLAGWGACGGCNADTDGSGFVDVTDLLAFLSDWGGCS